MLSVFQYFLRNKVQSFSLLSSRCEFWRYCVRVLCEGIMWGYCVRVLCEGIAWGYCVRVLREGIVCISKQGFSMCGFLANAHKTEVKVWKVKPLFQNFLMRLWDTIKHLVSSTWRDEKQRDTATYTQVWGLFLIVLFALDTHLHFIQFLLFLCTVVWKP